MRSLMISMMIVISLLLINDNVHAWWGDLQMQSIIAPVTIHGPVAPAISTVTAISI